MTDDAQALETDVTEVDTDVTDVEQEATEDQEGQKVEADSSTEKKGVEKRIDELTYKRREAEREAEYWKAQAQKPEPKPANLEVKTLEDFDYDESKYQAHLFQLAQSQAVEAAKRTLVEEQERQAQVTKQNAFKAKEDKYAAEIDDYMRVTRADTLPLTKDLVDIVSSSDEGPAVLYYLGKNPDITATLANLPPIIAAREIGKIEAKLAKEASTSKAPPPTPKIEGANPGQAIKADAPDSDKLSVDDWLSRRNKQLAKR